MRFNKVSNVAEIVDAMALELLSSEDAAAINEMIAAFRRAKRDDIADVMQSELERRKS